VYDRRLSATAGSKLIEARGITKVLDFVMNLHGPIWHRFGGSYVLPEEEVHVWRASLNLTRSALAKLRQILPPEERERADGFHFEADRRRCVIGRGYLRLLLGEILELPANELQFEYDEFGKPSVTPTRRMPVQFNVSHSGEIILIAIAIGRAVGIDVERIRTDLDLDGIAARFFSANERRILASLAGLSRFEAFYRCWTRKEAYLKARGVGLSLPLNQFDVCFLHDDGSLLLADRPDPTEALRWTMRTLEPGQHYVAALAVAGSGWKLKCLDYPTTGFAD
jgi:4'-phosphopantetheinyl transferase